MEYALARKGLNFYYKLLSLRNLLIVRLCVMFFWLPVLINLQFQNFRFSWRTTT